MMRKKQIFIIITAILIFCLAMTACAERTRIGQDDQHGGIEDQNSTTILDPDKHDPFDDIDDQGQPREKATEGETNDGLYAYEVGDTTVYTEHDLDRWIYLDDRFTTESYTLDLDAMLIDIWCNNNRGGLFENNVGYSYVIDGNNTKGLWFDVPDPERSKLYHAVTIWYNVDGSEKTTTIRMYDCESSNPPQDYVRIMSTYAIHREVASLLLYAIEQMEANPRSGALNDLELGDNFYCD